MTKATQERVDKHQRLANLPGINRDDRVSPLYFNSTLISNSNYQNDQSKYSNERSLTTRTTSEHLDQSTRVRFVSSSMKTTLTFNTLQCCGMNVTVLSSAAKVFVIDMIPHSVCDMIRRSADGHASRLASNGKQAFSKIYNHTESDLPACEIPGMGPLMEQLLKTISNVIGEVCGYAYASTRLQPNSWKEPHVLKYQKDARSHCRDDSDPVCHVDGSAFTWNLMLSDQREYRGGGTFIRCLQHTLKLKKGQVLVHPGNLFHAGIEITEGVRVLLVCFLDGVDPRVTDHSTSRNDGKVYRNQILEF